MKLKTNFGGLQVGKPPIPQLRWSKLFSTNIVAFTECQCAYKPKTISHQILLLFQPKKTEEILEFFFFFGKLIFQIFYCKILKKETLLQGESKQIVNIYLKLLILWPMCCMGAIMQRAMAIAGK
jgi:hypothetical protein